MKLNKCMIQQLASNVVFSFDWMESRMDSVWLLAEANLIPKMNPSSVDWQNEVETFCLKAIGLDEIDHFLIGFWGYDNLCNGLYRWADAHHDLISISKYWPNKANKFSVDILMERRRKIESIYLRSLPY